MCLGVTAEIVKIEGQKAEVALNGVTQWVSIAMTPKAKLGDYVMIHAGFAISIIDKAQAEDTIALFTEIQKVMEGEAKNA